MTIDVAAELSDRTYEGPFDLLLQLILAEEVDIHEVNLARIVDAYLVEIERMQQLDLDVATEFLLIAATLVELKARRLLPGAGRRRPRRRARPVGGARPAARPAARVQDVQGRLAAVRRAGRRGRPQLPRAVGPDERFAGLAPDLLAGLTPLRMREAAIRALTPRPSRASTCSTSRRSASASPTPSPSWSTSCRASGRITFARLTADLVERLDVIVRFLAVLELFKQGMMEVDQADRFGDILIEWTGRRRPGRRRRSPSTSTKDDAWTSDEFMATDDADHLAGDRGGRARGPRSRCRPSCWPSCSNGRSPTSSGGATSWPPGTRRRGVASNWCASPAATGIQTHPDLTPYVERFLLHDQRARLSGAALETLAIVAYKQPISRAQIASIRGVDPDGVLRTLQGRGYIDAVGRDPGPGQAVLYGTTAGVPREARPRPIDDLPPIAEYIPGADVVEALEAGLRVTDAAPDGPPEPPLWEQPTRGTGGRPIRASGCRRCWRAAAAAAGGCARS